MHYPFTPHECTPHESTPHKSTPRDRPVRAVALVAFVALLAVLLAGCSGGASTSTAGTRADVGAGSTTGGGEIGSVPGAAARSAAGSKAATPPVGVGSKLTRSASLDVQVRDITAAAAQVRVVATGLQAQVMSEQIGGGGAGDPGPLPEGKEQVPGAHGSGGFGTLTLSVPADKLDAALDQLARIGVVRQRSTSSQNITAQYIDTTSRLKTMRGSVERVRTLMAQAKDLGQVVALESELSRRQGDLESLESQLTALKSSVDRSTLAVSLSIPGREPTSSNDFLDGLRAGWDAFTSSTGGLLRGIGAVLPFALFFTLAGAPLVWWLRRRRMVSAT